MGESSSSGKPVLSKSNLEALSIKELQSMMERLGVDYSECHEKTSAIQKLLLSGRITVAEDSIMGATASAGCCDADKDIDADMNACDGNADKENEVVMNASVDDVA